MSQPVRSPFSLPFKGKGPALRHRRLLLDELDRIHRAMEDAASATRSVPYYCYVLSSWLEPLRKQKKRQPVSDYADADDRLRLAMPARHRRLAWRTVGRPAQWADWAEVCNNVLPAYALWYEDLQRQMLALVAVENAVRAQDREVLKYLEKLEGYQL